MTRGETSPLLANKTPKHHGHSHTPAHSHGDSKPCTNHHYMSINVYNPSDSVSQLSYSVLRPDCQHNHSSVLEPQFHATYQRDCEASLDLEHLEKMLQKDSSDASALDAQVSWVINLSLWVNIILFIFKCYAYSLSHSLSIAASVVDSFLDLCVQLVIYLSNRAKSKRNPQLFPVGTSRYEEIGLLLCSALMFIAGLQLIGSSIMALWSGESESVIDITSISVIVFVIVLKSALWYYCYKQQNISDTIETLAFDHRNDVLSNLAALAAIVFVLLSSKLWFLDPIGCIAISVYIANNWYELALEKIHQLVGRSADDEFINKLHTFVNNYHPEQLELDQIRCYHFGQRFLVELDICLPRDMSVEQSHDIAVRLQQTVEKMEEVERVFVHVDYVKRSIDEHDLRAVAELRLNELRTGLTPTEP